MIKALNKLNINDSLTAFTIELLLNSLYFLHNIHIKCFLKYIPRFQIYDINPYLGVAICKPS